MILPLVQDIKKLADHCEAVAFKYIWRDANFVADAVANEGYSSNLVSWCSNFPSRVVNAILFDNVGTDCLRGFTL